ncbi:hypothetical protein DASC09_013520 [Saccharomycopsis crataegensis]|uniref:non-specific serine/threonine protein kinase n=1 Tax=Saccharomycopsis crataegensis TaxID=43959 RepID=A0AAV5QHC2_9ASCO|nr:hypothetical protein DASC09_013520 [Saccharomycopsis crataegensis]
MARSYSASQFELLEQLGRGSFGVVYKARDKITNQIVAIKQIDLESSDEDINEIQKEITILSTCKFPQIIKYYGCYVNSYKLSIIMEILNGGSCLDLLVSINSFTEKQIAVICREIIKALYYLHSNNKIHRDIKAANILVDDNNGDVKIVDFGVATQLSNNLSKRNTFVGTPFWMSPEVILQHDYNYKTDIWSLGITAIELALGKPPLSNIHPLKVLFLIPKNNSPALPPKNPNTGEVYSKNFHDFIKLCLQKNPSMRPTAKQLLNHPFIKSAGKNSELLEAINLKRKLANTESNGEKTNKTNNNPNVLLASRQDSKKSSGSINSQTSLASQPTSQITFDFDDSKIEDNEQSTIKQNNDPLISPSLSSNSSSSSSLMSKSNRYTTHNNDSTSNNHNLTRNISPISQLSASSSSSVGGTSPKKISSREDLKVSNSLKKLSINECQSTNTSPTKKSHHSGRSSVANVNNSSSKNLPDCITPQESPTRNNSKRLNRSNSSKKHMHSHSHSHFHGSSKESMKLSHSRSQSHGDNLSRSNSQLSKQHLMNQLPQTPKFFGNTKGMTKSQSLYGIGSHAKLSPEGRSNYPQDNNRPLKSSKSSMFVDLNYKLNFDNGEKQPQDNVFGGEIVRSTSKSSNKYTPSPSNNGGLVGTGNNDSKVSLFDFEIKEEMCSIKSQSSGLERNSSGFQKSPTKVPRNRGNNLFDSPESQKSPKFRQSRGSRGNDFFPTSQQQQQQQQSPKKSPIQHQFSQYCNNSLAHVRESIDDDGEASGKIQALNHALCNSFNSEADFTVMLSYLRGIISQVDRQRCAPKGPDFGVMLEAEDELYDRLIPKGLRNEKPIKEERTKDNVEELLLSRWAEGVLERWNE